VGNYFIIRLIVNTRTYAMDKSKPLGRWTLTSLVVGNMVGSGVFLLPTNLAAIGSISIFGFMLTAVGTILLAIILSKLSQLTQRSGGPYTYVQNGLGNLAGFQTVYTNWISIWLGIIGIVVQLTVFLTAMVPALANPVYGFLVALIIIWLLTAINLAGINVTAKFQLLITIIKLLPILLIPIIGIWYFHFGYISENFNLSQHTHLNAINSSAALTLWAFIGVESATVPYDLVENPQKNIPFATIGGTLIAAIIYIFSSTIIIGMIPPETLALSKFPFAIASQLIFGTAGKLIAIISAIISCFGCACGWMFVQNQLAKAAGKDNLFPQAFARQNQQGVPVFSLIITAILISGILAVTFKRDASVNLAILVAISSMATLVPYIYTAISATAILKEYEQELKHAKCLFIVALLSVIFNFWAIISIGKEAIFYGSILLFISALLFALGYKNKSSNTSN